MDFPAINPALVSRNLMQRICEEMEVMGHELLANKPAAWEDRVHYYREICLIARVMRLASGAWAASVRDEASAVRASKSKARAEAASQAEPLVRRAMAARDELVRRVAGDGAASAALDLPPLEDVAAKPTRESPPMRNASRQQRRRLPPPLLDPPSAAGEDRGSLKHARPLHLPPTRSPPKAFSGREKESPVRWRRRGG